MRSIALFVGAALACAACRAPHVQTTEPARKAVFILLDGIPADVIEAVDTPALDEIAAAGGYARAHVGGELGGRTQTPTVSAPGYMSLISGTWADKHNVRGNSNQSPNYDYWNLFRIVETADSTRTTAIFSTWLDNRTVLIGEGRPNAGSFRLDHAVDGFEHDTIAYPHDKASRYILAIDERVSTGAATYIAERGPDLSWVYLQHTDDAGHAHGDSEAFHAAIRQADQMVGRIWRAVKQRQALGEDWMIVVTTDHGRDPRTGKGHGAQSERERTTWIATNQRPLSPRFSAGQSAIVDIAPSILQHLRIAPPPQVARSMEGVSFLVGREQTTGQGRAPYDRVILGGRVMDPASGLDGIRHVGIRAGRIETVSSDPIEGRDTISAQGLVVAPGFIDLHAHGQTDETYRFQALDGVTSSFELELGTDDVPRWYAERAAGQRINYGVSIGHIKARMAVMSDSGTVMPTGPGAYRQAGATQIQEIMQRVQAGLDAGAVSIGAGFTYTPAATRDELRDLFMLAARAKTPLHVHIRNGVAGLTEVLTLARESRAPLHVVHINSAGNAETPAMLSMLADARASGLDVTTEAYPYTAGMTEIQSATVQDMYRSAADSQFAQIEWPQTGERLTRERFAHYTRIGGPVVIFRNTEPMVTAAVVHPLSMIASDAYWQDGTGHPRTTGTFSRILGRYVREQRAMSLMDALAKMTIMPARRLEARVPAMRNKGRMAPGADADVTIFDPTRIRDQSTYRAPSLPPVGIVHVLVHGMPVVANGQPVEAARPGRAIRAP